MRLQKLLASSGYGSRRHIEKMIALGQVTLNGSLAKLGDQATIEDIVQVDGKPCQLRDPHAIVPQLWMLHKPLGTWSTKVDREDQPSVFRYFPDGISWYLVGRLDVNTSGLLLFTNSGPWAHQLMHPSFGHQRTYLVYLSSKVTEEMCQDMRSGLMLEDGEAKALSVQILSDDKVIMVLEEGRHRIVRRMWASVHCPVKSLKRIAYAGIDLPHTLRPGAIQQVIHLPKGLSFSYTKENKES